MSLPSSGAYLRASRRRSGAVRARAIWREDPTHPGLQFKRVHPRQPIYSVRIGLDWRAVGARQGDTIVWFWIGSHAEYDALLKQL